MPGGKRGHVSKCKNISARVLPPGRAYLFSIQGTNMGTLGSFFLPLDKHDVLSGAREHSYYMLQLTASFKPPVFREKIPKW